MNISTIPNICEPLYAKTGILANNGKKHNDSMKSFKEIDEKESNEARNLFNDNK